jgi:hypothetical protein
MYGKDSIILWLYINILSVAMLDWFWTLVGSVLKQTNYTPSDRRLLMKLVYYS